MSTTAEIRVPDIGDLSNVAVIEIHVAPGDSVSEGDTLVVVESDKATLEIPADMSGKVLEVRVATGDTVSEGVTIALVETAHNEDHATAPVQQTVAEPSAGQVSATAATAEPVTSAGQSVSQSHKPLETNTPDSRRSAVVHGNSVDGKRAPVYAPPSVRKLARELGVDISAIQGTGPKQRITRDDVKAFVKNQLSNHGAVLPAVINSTLAAFPDWPQVEHEKFGTVERVSLNRIARKSGPALARNAMLIPHVTYFDKTDITDTESLRQQLNSEASDEDAKITLLSFAVKAIVVALKKHPVFNASLEGDQLVMKHYWNIGVAVDTANGLLVPVIKDADKKGVRQIGNEMAHLAEAARGGALAPADMQGATFTISSLGSIGGTNFTPIINAPEVAILGLPRSEIQPVWQGEEFIPRRIQPLSLSFDHRVADGAEAARFIRTICDSLNDFRRTAV